MDTKFYKKFYILEGRVEMFLHFRIIPQQEKEG